MAPRPNLLQRAWGALVAMDPTGAPDIAPDAFDPRFWGGASTASLAGLPVTAATVWQLWSVQAVMEALAAPISTLPVMVFQRTGPKTKRPLPDHPVTQLLGRRPNWRQTAQEHRDEELRQLAFYRNSLGVLRPSDDGGVAGEIDQVHWSRVMRVERGSDGRVYYQVRRLGQAAGWDTYRDDQVVHIRKPPLTEDGLTGVPVYQTARETFGKALAVEQFGALYFANGGSGGGTLEHPSNFTSPDAERLFLEGWRAGGTGLNRHRDRLLKFGITYTPFTVKNDEAQFLETKKQAGYEVAAQWNMPPHRVGMLERATNNNIEQQSIEFVVYTLAPWIAAWEQAYTRDLLFYDDTLFCQLNVAGLLRGDIKTRWQAFALGRNWGWLCVDDIREMEGLDPLPDGAGQIFLQPVNMAEAGDDSGLMDETPAPAEDKP